MILAGTGHRPPRLGLDYTSESNRRLTNFVVEQLSHGPLPVAIISGMAQGFDQALAHAAILTGVPLTAAVPFDSQHSKWPKDAQRRYFAILDRAVKIINVCPGEYAKWKFVKRDQWMVDHCNCLWALWDGQRKGGTWHTVEYATQKSREIINLYDLWGEANGHNI